MNEDAISLLAALVQRNVDDAASTNERIHEYEQRQTREMAQAVVILWEGIDGLLPYANRRLIALQDATGFWYDKAVQLLEEPS